MSSDVVKVSPSRIRWKLSVEIARDRVRHKDWRDLPRSEVAETEKYRSIVQHFIHGRPWEDTPLFRIYRERLANGDVIRGCVDLAGLVAQYNHRVDALYADMREHGFRQVVDGQATKPIPVYIGHDGEILIGNQGNHRLAIAKVLGLDRVVVDIVGRHPESPAISVEAAPVVVPELPESARAIPAMTTEAERLCYYRLARECATRGAVVELGAWLGAATAYLAAAVRDAGAPVKVQSYDRFVWKPASHDAKAGGPIGMSQRAAFEQHLGPLLAHVDVHEGELKDLRWTGGPIGLLICDAPKRIKEISLVLTALAGAMRPGALMVWQDFAYFPSYDIPAAMMRLGDHVEFVEAAYPGTTAVFRVTKAWSAAEVSPEALSLQSWTVAEVEAAWLAWGHRLPEGMRPRFACGAAMFLCDLGATDRAVRHLTAIVKAWPADVLPKWQYLLKDRSKFIARYGPLVDVIRAVAGASR